MHQNRGYAVKQQLGRDKHEVELCIRFECVKI